jgi:hypothetical protein
VFSEHALCGQNLAELLHPEAELEVLGWETDLDQAVRRIRQIRPASIIVVGEEATTDCGPAVRRIQSECPDIQIAEINLETRIVRLYGVEEPFVQELRDLLSTVESSGIAGGMSV